MGTLQVRSNSTTGTGTGIVAGWRSTAASNMQPGPRRNVPAVIPESQRYFWSTKWQSDERESMAEIERGDYVEFDNEDDLIRWLLS